MKDKLRFGIVGAGAIAQAYMQAFLQCVEVEVVGVADVRREAADQMATRLDCRSYGQYESMAEDCHLDAVVVCTPPATHYPVCTHFLERRVNVLCEKPLTLSVDDAERMLRTAATNRVILTMASKFRYVEDVIIARDMVTSGVLGELILWENVFASRADMSRRWNSDPDISGGGVLIDNGTHSVDLMRYFLGPLAELHVLEGKRSSGLRVEETVTMFVRSTGGALGSIDLSWRIDKQRSSYIDVYGTKGAISIGWKQSRYFDYSKNDWTVFGAGYDKVHAFTNQVKNFSRAIQGREALLINSDDALASVTVIAAAYRSLRQAHWIPITATSVLEPAEAPILKAA